MFRPLTCFIVEVRACWLGFQDRGRGRGRRGWGRGRDTGPGPLDVRHGRAHEPREHPPPPLHVAQRHRPEDEPHRATTTPAER